jgi:hypothetical protein
MAKKIVFCADGTWDNANSHSNVYRFYKALSVTADQMPFYDDGVGAVSNFVLKIVEGAAGIGVRPRSLHRAGAGGYDCGVRVADAEFLR